SSNSGVMILNISRVLNFLDVTLENFNLLLSDAAPYMKLAGKTLHQMYPSLFHVTCIAHLLHNCASRVKEFFPDVNKLISSIKQLTHKNKTNMAFFKQVGYSPTVIPTGGGSWLDAAEYYAFNFLKVKEIVVHKLTRGDIIYTNALDAVSQFSLIKSLTQIHSQYFVLSKKIKLFISPTLTISEAFKKLTEMHFGNDIADIKSYLVSRFSTSEINDIVTFNRSDIFPILYSQLLNAQLTSIAMERSFSYAEKAHGFR
ncbi:hypothetical protein CDIK_4418, partial [Cucumispora dikerogammari]